MPFKKHVLNALRGVDEPAVLAIPRPKESDMPTPRETEKEDAYIARCMGDAEMNSKFPDEKQRAAVCHSYWGKYSQLAEAERQIKEQK